MKRFSFRRAMVYVIPIALFAAMIVWFLAAFVNTSSSEQDQELASVKNNIEKGVTMCYAIEGVYPESLEYLAENYNLIYDEDKYIVRYDCFADNVRPTVNVMEKQERQGTPE